MTTTSHRYAFTPIFLFVLSIAWVVLVWPFRFLPMEDYARWLCASQVFSQALHGQPVPGFALAHWPVPNSAFVGITGLLEFAAPFSIAGKLYLSLSIALYCAGAYFLLGSFTSRRDSALFLLPMLYVFHKGMWAGELSYSLGLGVFLLAAAYVLRAARPSSMAIGVLSIVLFFCHAIPFLCWGTLLCALMVFDRDRFPRLKTALAAGPSLLLFLFYAIHRGGQKAAHEGFDILGGVRQIPRAWSLFSPLHFFAPFFDADPRWLKTGAVFFNACAAATAAALIVVWFWKIPARLKEGTGTVKAALAAPLVLLAFFAFCPFEALTGVSDFNYRFLLPAFFLILSTLIPVLPTGRGSLGAAACAALAAVLFGFGYAARVSRVSERVYAQMSQADLSSDFREITANLFEPSAPSYLPRARLLPVHEVFYTFADYVRLEHRWPGPIFDTSFILPVTKYPRLLGNTDPRTEWPGEIVLLGTQPLNRTMVKMLPSRYRVVVDTEYVLILRSGGERDSPEADRTGK